MKEERGHLAIAGGVTALLWFLVIAPAQGGPLQAPTAQTAGIPPTANPNLPPLRSLPQPSPPAVNEFSVPETPLRAPTPGFRAATATSSAGGSPSQPSLAGAGEPRPEPAGGPSPLIPIVSIGVGVGAAAGLVYWLRVR